MSQRSKSPQSAGSRVRSSGMREAEIRKQLHVYRENLHCVCRLAIRTMVEKASCEGVDDSCPEFKNLATILEHILSHRLKVQNTWFGLEGAREFWDFIVATCSSLPHSSISTITNMEDARSPKAKGRAWIRSALMEKRLAEYFSHAAANTRAIKGFYSEGAFMRSDGCMEIVQELERLNTVDFSSCLKGNRLETGVASVIDYSMYLKSQLSHYDLQDASRTHQPITNATLTSPDSNQSNEKIQDNSVENRLTRLQGQFKTVCAQKNYLEELLAHKEKDINNCMEEIQRYQQTMRILEQQARQDRQSWEKLVLDLQDQIASLKEAQMVSRKELEEHLIQGQSAASKMNALTEPDIALDKLENMVLEVMPDCDSIQSCGEQSLGHTTSVSSITSSTKTEDKPEKEPTPSLVPLAGSFSSQVSLRSTETSWPGITNTHSQSQSLLTDTLSESSESGFSAGEGQLTFKY